jgi:hypothetical protein
LGASCARAEGGYNQPRKSVSPLTPSLVFPQVEPNNGIHLRTTDISKGGSKNADNTKSRTSGTRLARFSPGQSHSAARVWCSCSNGCEWHVILADSFWAPLAWFRIWTNTVPSAALTAAALWFAIAFCARQFLRKDAYAILALGTFFIACLVWAFFFVAINS